MEKIFPNIFKNAYEILPDSNMIDNGEKDRNFTFYRRIQEHEIKK